MTFTGRIAKRLSAARAAAKLRFAEFAAQESREPWWRWRKPLLALAAVLLLVLIGPRLYAEYHYLRIVVGGDVQSFADLRRIGRPARAPLLRLLRSRNSLYRTAAARRLYEHKGRAVVDALVRAVREDPDRSARMAALESLRGIGDPRAIPALMQLDEPGVPCAMINMGEAGQAAMLEFVERGRTADIRASSLGCLCQRFGPAPEVQRAVEQALGAAAHELRNAAAQCTTNYALAQPVVLSREEALARLKPLLGDPVVEVRILAAGQMGRLNDASGFDAMLAMAKDTSLPLAHRGRAILALEEIKDERAIPALLEIYNTDDYSGLKSDAGAALSTISPGWKRRRETSQSATK